MSSPKHPAIPVAPAQPEAPRAWDRRPDETENAHAYFRIYLDLAYPEGIGLGAPFVPRKLARVAEAAGVGLGHMGGLSAKHYWAQRALAYDRHIETMRLGAKASALEKMAESHSRLIGMLTQIAEIEVSKHLERVQEDPAVAATTLREASELVERIVKLSRLGNGLPTEITKNDPKYSETWNRARVWNLEALSLDELEKLEALREKAKGEEPTHLPPGETAH